MPTNKNKNTTFKRNEPGRPRIIIDTQTLSK